MFIGELLYKMTRPAIFSRALLVIKNNQRKKLPKKDSSHLFHVLRMVIDLISRPEMRFLRQNKKVGKSSYSRILGGLYLFKQLAVGARDLSQEEIKSLTDKNSVDKSY